MSDFTKQLLFTDDKDLIQLLEIEKQIDRLTNEIKEKSLIEKVRYLIDSALECIDYHINKKTDSLGIRALKGDLKNIINIINKETKESD